MTATNGSSKLTPDQQQQVEAIVANLAGTLASRLQFFRGLGQLDRRRDIDAECGYELVRSASQYQEMYNHGEIAARVVEFFPNECWQIPPRIYEDEDPETLLPFEASLADMVMGLRGKSWYEGEDGNPFLAALHEVDIKAGIGCFGVILLGLDDGLPLDQSVKGVEEVYSVPSQPVIAGGGEPAFGTVGVYALTANAEQIKGRKLLYLRTFSEAQARVLQVENNWTSPRYGQPVLYQLTMGDPTRHDYQTSSQGLTTRNVHWTRCIHVPSDTAGLPRMQQVLKRLQDLDKEYAAAGEGFWQNSFPITYFKTQPGSDAVINRDSLKDMMEAIRNGLQKHMGLEGLDPGTLPPQLIDPTSHINAAMEAVCIRFGFPVRIFKGSERGHLASTQDEGEWNERVAARRKNYCNPTIVIPTIDRLILTGVLTPPAKSYAVHFAPMDTQGAAEKATVAGLLTTALMAFLSGGGLDFMEFMDFLTLFLGLDDEEAKSLADNAAKIQDKAKKEADKAKADAAQALAGQQPPPGQPPAPGQGGQPPVPGQPPGQPPAANVYNPEQPRIPAGSPDGGQWGGGDGGGGASLAGQEPIAHVPADRLNRDLPGASRAYLDRVTPAQTQALHDFSGGAAFRINAALREGTPIPGRLQAVDQGMQEVFAAQPVLAQPVTVHRGLSMSPDNAAHLAAQLKESMQSGTPWTHTGYVSTTTIAKDVADSPVSMSISATHGIDMKPVSKSPEENEVLLNRGSQFRVKSVTEKAGGGYHVHLEQLKG